MPGNLNLNSSHLTINVQKWSGGRELFYTSYFYSHNRRKPKCPEQPGRPDIDINESINKAKSAESCWNLIFCSQGR